MTEEHAGFDEESTPAARDEIGAALVRMLPAMADAQVAQQTACLCPVASDGLLVLGGVPGLDQVYVGTGGARKGILYAPARAHSEERGRRADRRRGRGRVMRIVDAQIHLWGSGLPSNMAHRQVTSFTTEEAVGLMDEGGVHAAVIHPPGWDPNATEMAFKAVRGHPGRFAILGSFPLNRPDARALVESWRSQPGMLGLRYTFLQEPMRGWLTDGTLDWLWAAAERAGVPIARGGTTTLKDDAAMEHMPALIKLARHPNVAVKATGAPGYCSGPYPFTGMHKYLRQIYDAFGPARRFSRTDITKMPCPWRPRVTMFNRGGTLAARA